MRNKPLALSLLGTFSILLVLTLCPPAGQADPSPATPTVQAVLSTAPPPPHMVLRGGDSTDWSTVAAFGLTAALIGLMRRRLGWA